MGPGVRRACAASGRSCPAAQAGLLVSYRPLAGLTSGVLRAFPGPREASAEASRAAAGALATRSEERTPPTRARPFVAGADFPTVRVRLARKPSGAAPCRSRSPRTHPRTSIQLLIQLLCRRRRRFRHLDFDALHAAPSSRADAPVTAHGRLANPAPRRLEGCREGSAAAAIHHHVEARRRRGGSP